MVKNMWRPQQNKVHTLTRYLYPALDPWSSHFLLGLPHRTVNITIHSAHIQKDIRIYFLIHAAHTFEIYSVSVVVSAAQHIFH